MLQTTGKLEVHVIVLGRQPAAVEMIEVIILRITKAVVHALNLNTQKAEAAGSPYVRSQPDTHEFQAKESYLVKYPVSTIVIVVVITIIMTITIAATIIGVSSMTEAE